jgi:tetratricopeptide (TPR) repeat protein
MTQLRIGVVLAIMLTVAPHVARADDQPCAAEADAVARMKTRDPSLARPTDKVALQHMDAAKLAFGVQDYALAVDHYMKAGRIDPAPLILYNLGQTFRDAKDYEKAIRQYRLFLQRGKPGKEVEALVKCHIDRMTAELQQAAATAPPTGPDGGTEPIGDRPQLPSEPPHRDDPGPWTPKRKLGVGLAAGGAVALGLGVLFGVQANGLKDDAAQLCPDPSTPCDRAADANALSDRADTRALLANVSVGVGAALVVGGAVLWFLGAPSPGDGEHAALVPSIAPTSVGVVWSGRF